MVGGRAEQRNVEGVEDVEGALTIDAAWTQPLTDAPPHLDGVERCAGLGRVLHDVAAAPREHRVDGLHAVGRRLHHGTNGVKKTRGVRP